MKHTRSVASTLASVVVVIGSACVSAPAVVDSTQSQVQIRSYQTRGFDTGDKDGVQRATIATLQDLGFVVDKADATLGTVTATKLERYALRITVTVRKKGDSQILVRANAQYNDKAVDVPKPYQDFFVALEKALFLKAHEVD